MLRLIHIRHPVYFTFDCIMTIPHSFKRHGWGVLRMGIWGRGWSDTRVDFAIGGRH